MTKILKQYISAFLLLISSAALAVDHSSYATVEIVENLSMSQSQALNFGSIENIDGICIMASGGTLSGQDGQNCSGSSSPGEFIISGSVDQSIIITVDASAGEDGVVFTPEIDGSSIRTLDGGSTTVKIIGQLSLNTATLGAKNIEYTITANYQ